jgi:hypothetical protein
LPEWYGKRVTGTSTQNYRKKISARNERATAAAAVITVFRKRLLLSRSFPYFMIKVALFAAFPTDSAAAKDGKNMSKNRYRWMRRERERERESERAKKRDK